MDAVRTEISDGVLSIELNRPNKLNALDADLLEQFGDALSEIEKPSSAVGAVVLSGAGRSFCAGADRDALSRISTEAEIRRHVEGLRRVFLSLAEARVPVITAVHGHALGAGCGLVTASTVVLAAEKTQFGYPEMASGILPALVAPLLVKCVGHHRARALLLSSSRFSTNEAVAMGIITASCPGNPRDAAAALARRLASQRTNLVSALNQLLNDAGEHDLRAVLDRAAELNISEKIRAL
ncbi:MAG: enoyl-CoA hydratase/isomerase family protein [Aquamicrobium sp.]|nr:enoyl-CoA hydratase/isomerase family protein [Aquamicrobium sp.]